ncbi:histidine phosphatase family protein [Streptomyces sp. B1866]|uniref:SixA phosphatase family protein n=1 Tax=Streptomyces sp. B1866 TaxID=3075431 RepID=UPI00288F3CC6|nr:histidine phosphatase family protein [Streptomyces sp. B1866]MDT3400495.1 histidine phosphatase family protein [Streptomyces sp. B1866]
MSVDVPRNIIIVRHAKADWPEVPDHERPLAERGRQDAPVTGRWLARSGLQPQLALCSTAVRTRETWKLIVSELPERPRTVYDERLYEASLGELIAVVNETPDDVADLLLVGHNPGVHALADALAGEAADGTLEHMGRTGFATSGVAVIAFTGSWKSVEHGVGRLTAYWAPRS